MPAAHRHPDNCLHRSSPPTSRLTSELEGDPDMQELVDEFLAELPQRVAAVQTAFDQGNHVVLARIAHQLKGACAGYGYPTIGLAAAKLESTMNSNDEDALVRAKTDVDVLVELMRRALR